MRRSERVSCPEYRICDWSVRRVSPEPAELAGKVAIVTGAARGIGRAVTELFVERGARVFAVDRDQDELCAMVTAVSPSAIVSCVVDLADRAARAEIVPRAVQAWGSLDIVVNNAAFLGQRHSLRRVQLADWDQVLEVNLTALLVLAQTAAAVLPRGGAIVNLSSIQEHSPIARHLAYATTKGGVSAMTRALAVEFGRGGIRVNAVVPGVITTPGWLSEERTVRIERTFERSPAALLERSGTTREVAEAVAFLASDRASFITGAELRVDGGRLLSRRTDAFAAGMEAYDE